MRSINPISSRPANMPPAYDVVVLGAGGFTGRLVCEHIARDYQVGRDWE